MLHKTLLYYVVWLTIKSNAFNFFPKYAQIFTNNNPASYFGYSVLLQKNNGNEPSRLIVGSPRSNSSFTSLHKEIIQPGAVYSCPLNGNCTQFLFDSNGNTFHKGVHSLSYEHKKDHSWLGNAIDGDDVVGGLLIACAPRWINQIHKNTHYYYQNGLCYLLKDTNNIEKKADILIPLLFSGNQGLQLKTGQIYYYALGEAGMSVHLTKNNSEILVGAPGILQWKGMIVKYYDDEDSLRPGLSTWESNQRNFEETKIPNPVNNQRIDDFSYLGYSVSSGTFTKNRNLVWYVGGAPRGKNLYGQVLVYEYIEGKDDLIIHFEMKGRQQGEYFGSVLAVGDLNNDGTDDIIVGSPIYSIDRGVEIGCIYVYINDGNGKFKQIIIDGPEEPFAHFGAAISVIGDTNKDGFSDFVVGAPYYNKGQGAIFIYLGSMFGVTEAYSQRILASEVNPMLRGFGSSVSRGVDIDNNKYNDFAVGAYKSGHAVIIKSRPVVTINPTLISLNNRISINTKQFEISACLTYNGENLVNNLNMKLILNADQFYKRIYFTKNRGTMWEVTTQYQINKTTCQTLELSVTNIISDFTQPITIQMMYEIVENTGDGSFCASCPVLDNRSINMIMLSIPFEIGCGQDNLCQPDLKLRANFNYDKPILVIGSRDKLDVNIAIENAGEPAFMCLLHAEIPMGITFDKIPNKCQQLTNNLLVCDMGNPMFANDTKTLTLQLDISALLNNDKLLLKLNASSSGYDVNNLDNLMSLQLPLETDVEISILGISAPEQFTIVDENKELKQESLSVQHQFIIHNLGPSTLDDLKLEFLIPHRVRSSNQEIIKVFEPSDAVEENSLICTTSDVDGFYFEKSDTPVELDNEDSLERKRRSTEQQRSNALYSKMQKIMASDSEIPQDLPLNRTLSLSCNSPSIDIICLKIECISESLKKSQTQTLNFYLEANLKILDELRNEKDIIVLTSSVLPISKYFNVSTSFTHTVLLGSLRSGSAWKWIIVGLILGVILLCAIVFGLYKAGFFKRGNHEKIQHENEEESELKMDEENE